MSNSVIEINNLSKLYRLGEVGTGTISHDLNRWWSKVRGRGDPYLPILNDSKTNAPAPADEIWALKDINMRIEQGEIFGIIGRNGAGKSTLLKLISRITAPTSGQIKIRGRVASLLEVGTGMHPEMTARENTFLNGAILGMRRSEVKRKFDQIIDFAGVEKFVDTPIKRFSSGMRVRLGFAVAAHLDADILIVDEVLAVGDAMFQKKCINKMDDLASGGRTVLFVSHRMDIVNRLCSSAVLIENGELACSGTAKDVIEHYLHDTQLSATLPDRGSDKNAPIRIRSARLQNAEQQPSVVFSRSDKCNLELTYEVNRPVSGCHVFIRVLNSDELTILSSGDCDMHESLHEEREPGIYTVSISIPVHLLNDGGYYIYASAGIPFGKLYDVVTDVVRFNILDDYIEQRPEYLQTRPGLIVQSIPWVMLKSRV